MTVFMSQRTKTTTRWALASVALTDAYTDFILSRQAMNCTPATLEFYKYTAGAFLAWIENQGVTSPEEVTARLAENVHHPIPSRWDGCATPSGAGRPGIPGDGGALRADG